MAGATSKIPPHYLLAIELSRFEALPGRVYAIGFVRSYAAYLGLDSKTFVARVKAEMTGSDANSVALGRRYMARSVVQYRTSRHFDASKRFTPF